MNTDGLKNLADCLRERVGSRICMRAYWTNDADCWGGRTNEKTINSTLIYLMLSVIVMGLTPGSTSAAYIKGWGKMVVDNRSFTDAEYVAIAAGGGHCLGLRSDGSILGWGDNRYGQLNPPAGNHFVTIASGDFHSLGLKSDGSIVAWGISDGSYYDHGQVSDAPQGNDFVAIASGNFHSLGLKSDGSIVAWGISDGSYYDHGQVSDAPQGNDFVAIASGWFHALAIKSDGSIVGWGRNDCGQATPPAGNDFVAVAGGYMHSVALKSDGSIVGWGSNDWGQVTCPPGNDFVAIASGLYHNVAIRTDGSIVCWGRDVYGQVSEAPAGNDFVAIAAGHEHCLALKADGSLLGWGNNEYAQIKAPDENDFVAAAGGLWHSLGLRSDGSIVGWGYNYQDQINVPAGNDFIAIASGAYHGLALSTDGSIVGWGQNDQGQISVPAGNDFVAIASGGYHGLALRTDGGIVGWGRNAYGQASSPTGSDFVAVAAGFEHSLALKSDGTIVGWGNNDYGQVSPPAGNGFVAVVSGYYHGLALKSDGSIVGWGWNSHGQASPPSGNDFVAIAAGHQHSLALKSDGSIVGWGRNDCGQASPPAGNNFVGIAAGEQYSVALESSRPIASAGIDIQIRTTEQPTTLIYGTASDADGDLLEYRWVEDAVVLADWTAVPVDGATYLDLGVLPLFSVRSHILTLEVREIQECGLFASDCMVLTIENSPPVVGAISAPIDPVQVNVPITASADFTDPDIGEAHTALWDWGDGTTSPGTVTQSGGGGSVSDYHTYVKAGVYTVSLIVTDKNGASAQSAFEFVVVYDPSAGFVTGGGWIWSPADAYLLDPTLEGKANFGFVSKYQKGATVPTGQTQFMFKTADLNFHSSSYDWLVVTGSDYAMFKGSGTINGEGAYKFMLWAGDGTPDTFRIRIWTEDAQGNESAVYDNGFDQAIGGGSIAVHTN